MSGYPSSTKVICKAAVQLDLRVRAEHFKRHHDVYNGGRRTGKVGFLIADLVTTGSEDAGWIVHGFSPPVSSAEMEHGRFSIGRFLMVTLSGRLNGHGARPHFCQVASQKGLGVHSLARKG